MMKNMKISDAVIDMIENNKFIPFFEDDEIIITPKLDHEFCNQVLKYANKKESKGYIWYKRELECNRVAQALENDNRFEKFIHFTGRKAYRYLGNSRGKYGHKK